MVIVEDPMAMTIARLAECLSIELANAGGPGFCYSGLWIGSTPPPLGVADCSKGDCGVAWVRVTNIFPSSTFPAPDQEGSASCAAPLAYQVEIGVARCAPQAQGREMFPDPQAMFEANRLYLSDQRAARRALMCCLADANKRAGDMKILTTLGEWQPLENAAGKSGGVWTGWVGAA